MSMFLSSCKETNKTTESENPNENKILVIFDTDMGNDIDDALALAMLNNYIDLDKINLLGVISSKSNIYSVIYIDILNSWYGHPNIPLGIVKDGKTPDKPTFTKHVADMKSEGENIFHGSIEDYSLLPDGVDLYRKLLSEAPDQSVVIITVGFSTNTSRLLESTADDYSPLTGKELISKKVNYLSMMAGDFSENIHLEYNVVVDIPAAVNVYKNWPTKIITSPFAVGLAINYPAESISNDFSDTQYHPLVEGYKAYMPMPYDRPTWDLTSVLYVMEKDSSYFGISEPGKITIDPKDGRSRFTAIENGLHFYLNVDKDQAIRVKNRLIELVRDKP